MSKEYSVSHDSFIILKNERNIRNVKELKTLSGIYKVIDINDDIVNYKIMCKIHENEILFLKKKTGPQLTINKSIPSNNTSTSISVSISNFSDDASNAVNTVNTINTMNTMNTVNTINTLNTTNTVNDSPTCSSKFFKSPDNSNDNLQDENNVHLKDLLKYNCVSSDHSILINHFIKIGITSINDVSIIKKDEQTKKIICDMLNKDNTNKFELRDYKNNVYLVYHKNYLIQKNKIDLYDDTPAHLIEYYVHVVKLYISIIGGYIIYKNDKKTILKDNILSSFYSDITNFATCDNDTNNKIEKISHKFKLLENINIFHGFNLTFSVFDEKDSDSDLNSNLNSDIDSDSNSDLNSDLNSNSNSNSNSPEVLYILSNIGMVELIQQIHVDMFIEIISILSKYSKYKFIYLFGHSRGFVMNTIISFVMICYSNITNYNYFKNRNYFEGNIEILYNFVRTRTLTINNTESINVCGTGGFPVLFKNIDDFKIYYDAIDGRYLHIISSLLQEPNISYVDSIVYKGLINYKYFIYSTNLYSINLSKLICYEGIAVNNVATENQDKNHSSNINRLINCSNYESQFTRESLHDYRVYRDILNKYFNTIITQ